MGITRSGFWLRLSCFWKTPSYFLLLKSITAVKMITMYKYFRVSVTVPAYNEAQFIKKVLKGFPNWVDNIVVVDDCSTDGTYSNVLAVAREDRRIHPIRSFENQGVGGSVMLGHEKGIEYGADILVVMAGDGQMNPAFLPLLLDEIVETGCAYVKGNRFLNIGSLKAMPPFRIVGNAFMTFLTRILINNLAIGDPLNGYTAINAGVYKSLDKTRIGRRYDFEISLLIELARFGYKVRDVYIPAVYGKEKSDINWLKDTFMIMKKLVFTR